MKFCYFLTLLTSISLFSCSEGEKVSMINYGLMKNGDVLNEILNFELEYELHVPGVNRLTYNHLWTGYDLENQCGPITPKENRLYTFLTKYESDFSYYFIYLPKSELNKAKTWFADYASKEKNQYDNWHFSSDENVIDGKYLLYCQKNNVTNVDIWFGDDFSSIPYQHDDKCMIACLKSKKMIVLDNVSLDKEINNVVDVYARVELEGNVKTNSVTHYQFSYPEADNISFVDKIFSYSGYKLEAYPLNFENISCCYAPKMGASALLQTVGAEFLEENIILPRYCLSNKEYYDLLDPLFNTYNLLFEEDVYRNFKVSFANAFIKDLDYFDGHYKYALFNKNDVIGTIKNIEE